MLTTGKSVKLAKIREFLAIVPLSIYKSCILWENWANCVSDSVHPVCNVQGWRILAGLEISLNWEGERLNPQEFAHTEIGEVHNQAQSVNFCISKSNVSTSEVFPEKLKPNWFPIKLTQYNLKELHKKTLFCCTWKADSTIAGLILTMRMKANGFLFFISQSISSKVLEGFFRASSECLKRNASSCTIVASPSPPPKVYSLVTVSGFTENSKPKQIYLF